MVASLVASKSGARPCLFKACMIDRVAREEALSASPWAERCWICRALVTKIVTESRIFEDCVVTIHPAAIDVCVQKSRPLRAFGKLLSTTTLRSNRALVGMVSLSLSKVFVLCQGLGSQN